MTGFDASHRVVASLATAQLPLRGTPTC